MRCATWPHPETGLPLVFEQWAWTYLVKEALRGDVPRLFPVCEADLPRRFGWARDYQERGWMRSYAMERLRDGRNLGAPGPAILLLGRLRPPVSEGGSAAVEAFFGTFGDCFVTAAIDAVLPLEARPRVEELVKRKE